MFIDNWNWEAMWIGYHIFCRCCDLRSVGEAHRRGHPQLNNTPLLLQLKCCILVWFLQVLHCVEFWIWRHKLIFWQHDICKWQCRDIWLNILYVNEPQLHGSNKSCWFLSQTPDATEKRLFLVNADKLMSYIYTSCGKLYNCEVGRNMLLGMSNF